VHACITPIRANIVGPFCSTTKEQRLHRGLPFRRLLFGFGQLGDIGPGVFERDELATAGRRYWIVEFALPSGGCLRQFVASIGSRNRFMVNSIFLDWIWRPALDLGLVPILRVALKVFLCQLPGKGDVTGELFADEGVFQWSNLSRGVAVGWCGRRCRAIGVL
jgi:hypothetical protein